MKDIRKTHVPVPTLKPKPKAKPKDRPSKAPLSQEFIGSDDEPPAETAPTPKPKPKTTIAVHRPDGAAKLKQKPAKKDAATPNPPPKAKPTKNGARASASASDSGSSSDSETDESDANEASEPAQAPARPPQTQPHAVSFRPAQAYVPPHGFAAVPCNDKSFSKSARIFDSLEGKQLWHITAPVGLSLSDLTEIAMDNAMNGGAVLQHKGTSYGFSTSDESAHANCEVMVPHKNGYKAVSTPISQRLRLQAAMQLPKLSSFQADQNTGSEAAASITRSTIRAPRPQLKGLKMRFLPTGFGGGDTGTLGDSDSEADVAQATTGLVVPNELNLPQRKEKRKHTELHGDSRIEPPSKKHKKPRSAEQVQRKEERRAKKEKKRAQGAGSSNA